MSELIKSDSQSTAQIKSNIESYLEGLGNWPDIKDSMPASNLTLIIDLLAGYASFLNFRHKMEREETYLQKAKQASSVYQISSTFGYSLNRFSAPVVDFIYTEAPTTLLESGTILGYYQEDRPLYYFGPSILIEKLDIIKGHLGEYFSIETPVTFTDDEMILDIEPQILSSIDRSLVSVEVNGSLSRVSREVENYVVFGDVVDFSPTPHTSRLFISDRSYGYGLTVASGDKLFIRYLETDGHIDDMKLTEVKAEPTFQISEISSLGTSGDALDKIRKLAPLLFSALRRMVTARDHTYITESHPLIRSAYAERDQGQPLIVQTYFQFPFAREFQIQISDSIYTIGGDWKDSEETIRNKFKDLITHPKVEVLNTGAGMLIIQKDSRDSDLTISANENVILTVLEAREKPACCTVEIYYVKHDTIDRPRVLTSYEQTELSIFFQDFKMVGVTVVLRPAQSEFYKLALDIKLSDTKYDTLVREAVKVILSQYELTLNKGFFYGEALAQIAKISTIEDNEEVLPVKSVVPAQTVFDVEPQTTRYLYFNEVELNIS